MIPYFSLIILPVLGSFLAIKRNKNGIYICCGADDYIKMNNLAIPIFFIILFFMLACKDISVGNDTINYKFYFDVFRNFSFKEIFDTDMEVLYVLLCWVVGQITDKFQWFLLVVAIITIIPIAQFYAQDKRHSYLKIILFVNISNFVMLLSGIRQSIAVSIGLIAYHFVKEKKFFLFLLCVLIAIGFHHSAFMLLGMYPLYHVTVRKKHLLFIIPVIGGIFVFNRQIFGTLTSILSMYSDKYANIASFSTGAVTMTILFVIFCVFSYVVPNNASIDREIMGLRNFLLLAVALQSFASMHTLAMRMNYYYAIFIPVLISKILEIPNERYKKVSQIAEIVMCSFFTLYYVYTLVISYYTGGSLHTVPYVSFWR